MEFFMMFLQRNGILTLVIFAVLLVRLILRRQPKKYSYLLWSVVGIRMLFQIQLPARFSLLSLWHFLMQRISDIRLLTASQNITDLQAGTQNLQPAGQLTTGQTVTGTVQGLSQTGAKVGSGWDHLLQICMLIWIAGVIALMLYGIFSYFKCRKMTAQAVHMEANIWECDHLTTPFVLGIIKPRIYIPFHLSAEEKPYILAHEMYHIKRGDPVVRLLAFVLLAAYWINPFVWLAYFLMIRDMEMSCDEAVLLQLGTQIRKAYSNSLLTFATGRKQVTFSPLAFGESDTSGRIKNILDFKKPKVWGSLLAILAVILVAVFCLTGQKTEDDTSASQTADVTQSEQQVTDSSQSAQAEEARQETEAARQTAEQAQQESETTADAAKAAEQAQQDAEKAAEAAAESARQEMEKQVQDMMDNILAELDGDLSKAYQWVNTPKFKDDAKALIKMAEDPTGQYAAYGFLCGEYGSYGILLNDKLNGEDNWNYFYVPWAYTGASDPEPTMEKAADGYSGTFTFPAPANDPADSSIQVKTWRLQSYDTGTIEIEDVTKSAENASLYGNTIAGLDDQTQFALVDIGLEHTVLFTTEQSYTYDAGVQAALDCHVYYVIDGNVKDLGSVESEGTAYPVSYGQGCIYTAGNHSVSKYVIDETTYQLICEQKDEVSYDVDGNASYIRFYPGTDKEKSSTEKAFNEAVESYSQAVPISFSYGASE